MNFVALLGARGGFPPPPYLKFWKGGVLRVLVFGVLFGMCTITHKMIAELNFIIF